MALSLRQRLDEMGIKSEDLDAIVHGAGSVASSTANNGGVKDQLEYLAVVCGWDDDAIMAEVRRECG